MAYKAHLDFEGSWAGYPGGWTWIKRNKFLKLTRASRFNFNAETVARPVWVNPIILE